MAQGAILTERLTFGYNLLEWKLIYKPAFFAFCLFPA